LILHIPHSKSSIPKQYRDHFVLSDSKLSNELLLLVDHFTDKLYEGYKSVIFQYPRLLVDVERFPDDKDEPMSKLGMGFIYTKCTDGSPLKRKLTVTEVEELRSIYDHHHKELTSAVELELAEKYYAFIVDCHSFPSMPLTCDQNQKIPRPDFCIGTDDFHTPTELTKKLQVQLESLGYVVKVNEPYAGTIVPNKYYGKNLKVKSIMIEVNRSLYMNEKTGTKAKGFNVVRSHIQETLNFINHYIEETL
jgi:N-formylglutamate deformylase